MSRIDTFTERHPYLAGFGGAAISIAVFIGLVCVVPTIP